MRFRRERAKALISIDLARNSQKVYYFDMSIRIVKIVGSCCFFLLLAFGSASGAEKDAAEHVRLADDFLAADNYLQAVTHYRLAIGQGARSPNVYRNLAEALYEMRLVDDAIFNMEQAVRMEPDNHLAVLELGTFHLAAGNWSQAADLFSRALEKDPANGATYFYLGEAFYGQKRYDFAWLAARTALKLRFAGSMLVDKLRQAGAPEPKVAFLSASGEKIAIRNLLLEKEEDVQRFWREWEKGVSFESLVFQFHQVPETPPGGYVGTFSAEDLKESIRQALAGQEPYHRPVTVAVEEGTLIVQRVLPFSPERWQRLLEEKKRPVEPAEAKTEGREIPASSREIDYLELSGIDQRKIVVYAGTFSKAKNAADLVRRLRKLGYDAGFIQRPKKDGGEFFHVIAGLYDSAEDAGRAIETLEKQGFEGVSPGL